MNTRKLIVGLLICCVVFSGCSKKKNDDASDLPKAYQEIVNQCSDILVKVEDGHFEPKEDLGDLAWFADQVLHFTGTNPKEAFCYSLKDINKDGINELILACKLEDKYTIFNVYTLNGNEAVLLAKSYERNTWYITEDGKFMNERSSEPAVHEIYVYGFGEKNELTEEYHIYNSYLEDKNTVGLYEAYDGNEPTLINTYDDPNNSDLWSKYGEIRSQYTAKPYQFEFVIF